MTNDWLDFIAKCRQGEIHNYDLSSLATCNTQSNIDVNTGKNVAKKEVLENFLRVNKEAAEEIARQLRLRNLSGIIVVDFMNLKSKEANAELLSYFRAALRNDPVPTQLVDMTKLGLVEVTRKKVRKSLREVIG